MIVWGKIRTRNHTNGFTFKLLIDNSGVDSVVIDFQGVKFATRSFIDEFYNLFLKTPDANAFRVELANVPADIKAMLDSVSVHRFVPM